MESIPDLSHLSENEFEAERCRIIKRHLDSLPPEQAKRMRAFQMQLDNLRDTMAPELFMAHCFGEAGRLIEKQSKAQADLVENLNHLTELFTVVDVKTGGGVPPKPNYDVERSARS